MQRKDFSLELYCHLVLQLLLQLVRLLNQRADSRLTTRPINVRAHRGEPLNEVADAMAAEAGGFDPARPAVMDLDPEEEEAVQVT
jgi:hypothetical protein